MIKEKISKQKKIEKLIIQTAIKLAKDGKGSIAIFNIGEKIKYRNLFNNDVEPFNILDSPRRYEIIAAVDGAVIISPKGKIISYSAQILNPKPFMNFGMRHASGYTASKGGNLVVISSEEDRKVKVFKDMKMIMQIDPLEKDVEKKSKEIVGFLESFGVGALGSITTTVLIPTLGITLIPGIIIFGSAHFILKSIVKTFEK